MTTATIGALNIKVTVDNSELIKGLKDSDDEVKKGGDSLRKSVNKWGAWAAGAAAAVAGVTAAIVKGNLESIRELDNMARAANMVTAEFERGAFAASQFGIEQEKYGDILKDVNDKVGDFLTTGAGGMTDFFEKVAPKVGVTAKQFKNLSGQQALGLYVDTLQKANLTQAEMTFHMEAIASDSTRLLPLFKDNAKALNELTAEAEGLGIGLSQIDVAKAELASASLAKAGAFIETIGQKITIAVAPVLSALTDAFTDAASSAGGMGEVIDGVMSFAVKVIGHFANGLRGLQILFHGIKGAGQLAFAGVLAAVQAVVDGIFWLGQKIKDTLIVPLRVLIVTANALGAVSDEILDDFMAIDTMKFRSPDILRKQIDSLSNSAQESFGTMHDLAMQELPSDSIDRYVNDAKAKMDELAEEVAANRALDVGQVSTGTVEAPQFSDESNDRLKRIKEQYLEEELALNEHFDRELAIIDQFEKQKRLTAEEAAKARLEVRNQELKAMDEKLITAFGAELERLNEKNLTESEQELLRYEERLAKLDQFTNQELEMVGGKNEMMRILQQEHSDEMNRIQEAERQAKIGIVTSTLDAAAQALSVGGKKASKIQKAIAITNAVIKGKEAAVAAWQAGMSTGGPWAPVVAAAYTAASIAKTASMISSIKGGGKSMSGMSGGGGGSAIGRSPSSAPAGSGGSGGRNSPREISISMMGQGMFSTEQVRELIGQINQQVGDGVELNVNTDSGG